MNLYMVRHGQTAASRENRFSGSSDPPLTAAGEAMAQEFARTYGLEVLESNQAQRTIVLRGTAGAFGAAFGVHLRQYRDASGQAVAYLCSRDNPTEALQAKMLTKDEARGCRP